MQYKFWKLPVFADERGKLCVVEWRNLPFSPKRAYYIYDVKGLRGGHAHKKEKEVFVCVAGSFRATIHDGKKQRRFMMNKPGQVLYTDAMVWHEFDRFSKNAIMLAISSTPYEGTKGYIMKLDEFLSLGRASARLRK